MVGVGWMNTPDYEYNATYHNQFNYLYTFQNYFFSVKQTRGLLKSLNVTNTYHRKSSSLNDCFLFLHSCDIYTTLPFWNVHINVTLGSLYTKYCCK